MIPISTWRAYWNNYIHRIQGIGQVIQVGREDDLTNEIKNIGLNELFLAIVIPSYNSQSPDADNYLEDASCMMFVMIKIDRKDFDQNRLTSLMDSSGTILKACRFLMQTDKSVDDNGGTIMRNLSLDDIHTDPELNYLGCYGWSMSFMVKDIDFSIPEQQYHDIAVKVRVTDGAATEELIPGSSYTCQFGNVPAEVTNSDESWAETVAPGGAPLIVPDTKFTDSDGSVRYVPATNKIVATPPPPVPDAVVENSDQSYQATFSPPGPKVLPDINFTDSDGQQMSIPACKDIVATPIPDNRTMKFGFPIGSEDIITITADADQASTWQGVTSTNVATAAFELNGSVANLPFIIAEGDTLKVTIMRTDAALAASLKLAN